MTTWAILPVKPFNKGKSRLRSVVCPEDLERLNQACFERTLGLLSQSPLIDRVLVISRDRRALDIAVRHGCVALYEQPKSNLNAAVKLGLEFIYYRGPGSVLIIPSDLPLLKDTDLNHVLSVVPAWDTRPSLVIVPDLAQQGTNAMYLSQPDIIRPAFGKGSFQKHCAQAITSNAKLIVYLNRDIQHDLDTPADLESLKSAIPLQYVELSL